MSAQSQSRSSSRGKVLAVLVLALAVRLLISWHSYGTNDVTTWQEFGQSINARGLAESYRTMPKLNHPPIPAYWASIAYSLTAKHPSLFPFVFRIPGILADVASCWVLALVWLHSGAARVAVLAALAMALNLDALLISSYHGNTDSVYACFALLASYLLCGRRAPLLAGLALAAAINVKLLPVIFIAPLLALCANPRELIRCVIGLSIGVIPFAISLAMVGSSFYANALTYTSDPNRWGIIWIARGLKHVPGMHQIGTEIMERYHAWGRFVVLGASVALALLHRIRKWNGYELACAAGVAMLVFAPGFAVQYTVAAAALLLAVNIRAGSAYGLLAGLFVLVTYILYGTRWNPPRSEFTGLIPYKAAAVGVLVWLMLVLMLARAVWKHVVRSPA